MDKTLKLRAYEEDAKKKPQAGEPAKAAAEATALERKTAQLEEEQKKSLELFKTIIQMREELKQAQERAAALEAKLHKLDSVEGNQLVRKNAELEETKKQLGEFQKLNEQLRESIKQEQAKVAEMAKKSAALEARVGESASSAEKELAAARKDLAEEKQRCAELTATVEQLRESIKQEMARTSAGAEKIRTLETRAQELASTLEKIAGLAARPAS